jgi:hypothetical protein
MLVKINPILMILVIKKTKTKNNFFFLKKKLKTIKIKHKINYYIKIFFFNNNNFYKFTLKNNLNFFNNKYLQNIYNLIIKEKNINCLDVLPVKIKNFLSLKTINVSFKQFGIKYFNEVAFLFITCIFVKNAKNICLFIKKSLDNVHFKKHRLYFFFFFHILINYIEPFFKELKIKGLCLIFKGKLGKGGNSRKQVLFYKNGLYSLSNKNLKLEKNK